jgi:beta-glucosidase
MIAADCLVYHGVGYTRFTYANLKFNTSTIGHCDSIKVSVDVSNSVDGVDGEEVVQLYVKTPDATVKAPRVRLADFARVAIDAGKTVTVELVVSPKYFSVVKNEGNSSFWHPQIAVEAGALELSVGGGQPDFASGVLKGKVTVKNSGALTTHYTC